LRELAAEPVRIGPKQREVQALDSSTIARFRAVRKLGAAGKGYWGRAGKAVRANIVATINSVVLVGGIRMGIVRRTRLRRWSAFHFEEQAATILDVVRVDDPKYDKPLLIGGTARELSTGFARARVGARGATTRKRFGQSRHQSSRRPA
jgi:hypothetical protein